MPEVFGWTAGRPQFEGTPASYVVWEIHGQPVAGTMELSEAMMPPDVPPPWGVCFAVADCDATVAKARAEGGTIASEPISMPIGRFAGSPTPRAPRSR